MKGLLRRGFYQIWPIYAVALGTALVISLFPERRSWESIRQFGRIFPLVLLLNNNTAVRLMDSKCGWDRYVRMLPCSSRDVVLSRFILRYCDVAVAALTIAVQGIGTSDWEMAGPMLAFAVPFMLVILAVEELLIHTMGYEKGHRLTMVVYAEVAVLLVGGIFTMLIASPVCQFRFARMVDTLVRRSGVLLVVGTAAAALVNAAVIPYAIRAYRDHRGEEPRSKVRLPVERTLLDRR